MSYSWWLLVCLATPLIDSTDRATNTLFAATTLRILGHEEDKVIEKVWSDVNDEASHALPQPRVAVYIWIVIGISLAQLMAPVILTFRKQEMQCQGSVLNAVGHSGR